MNDFLSNYDLVKSMLPKTEDFASIAYWLQQIANELRFSNKILESIDKKLTGGKNDNKRSV